MLSNVNLWHPATSTVGWEIIINNRLTFNFREREIKLVGVEIDLGQQEKLAVTYFILFYISCHSNFFPSAFSAEFPSHWIVI